MQMVRPAGSTVGMSLYVVGLFFFAVNDALGKWLVVDYSVGQIMMLRAVGASMLLVPMLLRQRVGLRLDGQLWLHAARIVCSIADTYSFYLSTRALPLADVMTFYLAAPLIIVALSAPLLGERVGIGGWAAVVVGFAGVMVALHPSGDALSPSALVALFGATMFALSITITRKLRGTHWLTLVTHQTIGTGLFGAATCTIVWVTPSLVDAGLMFLVGIVSSACFMCITKALALAPASLLAPLQYTSIIWAVLMGWMFWSDVPTPSILIGIAIIIGSGLSVFLRKRVAIDRRPVATDA